ncbi:MAG: addiction module protein [Bacteroidota bacterium]
MSPQLKDLENKALQLPVSDRELLANHLLQSVHDQEINDIESQWISVAEERYEALANGLDSGVSESEFFAKLTTQ